MEQYLCAVGSLANSLPASPISLAGVRIPKPKTDLCNKQPTPDIVKGKHEGVKTILGELLFKTFGRALRVLSVALRADLGGIQ